MSKTLLWLGGLALVGLGGWYLYKQTAAPENTSSVPTQTPTTASAGTATALQTQFGGIQTATMQSLQAGTNNVTSAFQSLNSLASNFGYTASGGVGTQAVTVGGGGGGGLAQDALDFAGASDW